MKYSDGRRSFMISVASLWNRRPEELKLIWLFVYFWFMLRPCRTIVLKLVLCDF